ncbi:MAG: hypothetical protein H6701_14775 [Myxococcales bacterium]|nr:hypothetical protein [Myxococcales bacterium]
MNATRASNAMRAADAMAAVDAMTADAMTADAMITADAMATADAIAATAPPPRSRRRALHALAALTLLTACDAAVVDRAALNDAARAHLVDDTLAVRVQGAAIVATARAAGTCPPAVTVRAQSFDVRLEVQDTGCQPRALHLTVTHLPRGPLERTARPFLGAVEPAVGALLGAIGGGLDFTDDPHDPRYTALAPEAPFEARTDALAATAGVTARWTICTDRNRQAATLLPGHRPLDACRVPAVVAGPAAAEPAIPETCDPTAAPDALVDPAAGACATFGAEPDDPLATAPLIIRHRLRLPLDRGDCLRFATWGNNAAHPLTRAAILRAVTDSDARFALITGDMTAIGDTTELAATRADLDRELRIPWYATLGDTEAQGPVADNFVSLIGGSTFAFDAGPTRVIVLDSGDRGLFAADRRRLYRWLEPDARLWWADPPPPTRLVLTHVPPFDPSGARGDAFRHRPEAAALVAALQRARVPYLISSQFAIFRRQPVAGIEVIHAGGAGAPMESGEGDRHHWLLVTVDPTCDDPPPCVDPAGGCPCVRVDRVPLGADLPDLPACGDPVE